MRITVNADVVRQHLARRNLSQNNLALRAEVSRGYLSQILRHRRCPGPEVRERLMRALRVRDFDELFRVEGGDGKSARGRARGSARKSSGGSA